MADFTCDRHEQRFLSADKTYCLKCYSDAMRDWKERGLSVLDGSKPIYPSGPRDEPRN